MLTVLRQVSVPYFARHKLRAGFTTCGVALGVAAMIGIRLVHESTTRSYESAVEQLAGRAALEITNGEIGVPEELLEAVRTVPGVRAAAASVQGYVAVPSRSGERLFVFGIDLVTEDGLHDYELRGDDGIVDDPVVFVSKADSVALTGDFLQRNGLAVGDRLEVRAPKGPTTLTVRATVNAERGPAALLNGRLAVMDLFAAQRLLQLDRRFTLIDVGVEDGVDVDQVAAAIGTTVAGRGEVQRPRARGEALERLLTTARYESGLGGMIAVIMGVYVIFNTMMTAVAQRRREVGILRCLGMRRREVIRLIAAEASLLAAVGCAIGVPLGLVLARLLASAFAESLSGLYFTLPTPEVSLRIRPVCWSVGFGLVSALIATGVPAAEAARVQPREAMRRASRVAERSGTYWYAAAAGLVCVILAAVAWSTRDAILGREMAGSVTLLGLIVGASLLAPAAIRALARRLPNALERLLGAAGLLASRSIVSNVGRVAATCSAFLVSLAGAIVIASAIASLQRTLTLYFEGTFSKADLLVSAGAQPLSPEAVPLPASLLDEMARLPEVQDVHALRIARVAFEGSVTALVATDAQAYQSGLRTLHLLEGDPAAALHALADGSGIVVNEAFSRRFHRRPGEVVTFAAPGGEVRLPIVGIYFDFGFADLGTVLVERSLYSRLWRDSSVDVIELRVVPGRDVKQIAEQLMARWGDEHALVVLTNTQFAAETRRLLRGAFSTAYPLIAIAVLIALLGVVNALVASVLDRVGEIGVLRAIGATRGQVARSVVLEANIIGAMAGLLAVAVGSLLGWLFVEILFRGMFGVTMFYAYPTLAVVIALPAAIALAGLAGYWPGAKAGRLPVAQALQYE